MTMLLGSWSCLGQHLQVKQLGAARSSQRKVQVAKHPGDHAVPLQGPLCAEAITPAFLQSGWPAKIALLLLQVVAHDAMQCSAHRRATTAGAVLHLLLRCPRRLVVEGPGADELRSILTRAVQADAVLLVMRLHRAGLSAQVQLPDAPRQWLLHLAAEQGSLDMVRGTRLGTMRRREQSRRGG